VLGEDLQCLRRDTRGFRIRQVERESRVQAWAEAQMSACRPKEASASRSAGARKSRKARAKTHRP
jgi:hypothetical protein